MVCAYMHVSAQGSPRLNAAHGWCQVTGRRTLKRMVYHCIIVFDFCILHFSESESRQCHVALRLWCRKMEGETLK